MAHDTKTLVSQFQASGLSQKEFCEGKGIAVSTLQYHLGKFRKNKQNTLPGSNTLLSAKHFVPLHLAQAQRTATTVIIVQGNFSKDELGTFIHSLAG